VKRFEWDKAKNAKLKKERGIGFEDITAAILLGDLMDVIGHHNPDKYPNQNVYVVKIEDYIYLVPFVEDEEKKFLKTIYPSRKMTKKYVTERKKL